ncbi:MAG TPA: tRNA1(Val) (adenine(37)-N6)-methyltransferase [Bacillales bacterium]|nr:tRNA1(Val) (adenine(37)-N6)-methyltransferase [Bacillales bacterium]
MTVLKENERLDYLFFDRQLKIIQSCDTFAFSLDSVLLASFVHVPIRKGRLIDLCSGNGAVPLMLSTRTKGGLTGVEIQPSLHDMAVRSVAWNDLQDRIELVCGDVRDAPEQFGYGNFDVVTCNPPYFSTDREASRSQNPAIAKARHEMAITLEKIVSTAEQLLKQGGRAAFVYPAEKFLDLAGLLRCHRLEPKRLLWVYPREGKRANRVLIEGMKDGRPGAVIEEPLIVYNDQNEYTKGLRSYCDMSSIR